jgi:hypothetical protein
LVSFFIIKSIFKIVIGIAANKGDLYDDEAVPEEKARQFAEKIGAIFKLTSAYTSVGIEELFISLGSKFIDPNFKDDGTHKPNARAIDETMSPSEPQQEVQQQKQPQQNSGQNMANDNIRHQSIKLDPQKAKEKKKKKFC